MKKTEKQTYIHPVIEVIAFESRDIITTSDETEIDPIGGGGNRTALDEMDSVNELYQ